MVGCSGGNIWRGREGCYQPARWPTKWLRPNPNAPENPRESVGFPCGTAGTAVRKLDSFREQLKAIEGKRVIDTDEAYAAADARSRLDVYGALGLSGRLAEPERRRLELAAAIDPVS